MTDNRSNSNPPSLTLADIYYVLFRHKWKIGIITAVGIIVAFLIPVLMPLPYQSEAKLFIRYVLESKSPGQVGANDSKIKSPDERGENIINTELEILTSLDLAREVITNIGPEKILAKLGGGADAEKAAAIVRKNVLPEVPKKSDVIRLIFQHGDPEIVQLVLNRLIETYLKRHAEIHRAVGVLDDSLARETELLRSRLVETEAELRRAKTNAHIISLDDAKKGFGERISKIQQSIFDAEAELAERQAALGEMAKQLHLDISPTNALAGVASNVAGPGVATTNGANSTDEVAAVTRDTPGNATAPTSHVASLSLASAQPNGAKSAITSTNDPSVPPEKLAEYKRVSSLLDTLVKKEQDLLLQFTTENAMVKSVQQQIATNDKLKKQLEDAYPGLLVVKVSETKPVETSTGPKIDLVAETSRITALEAKIKVLTGQLAKIRKESSVVDDMEGSITELQRTKELQEAHYKYFAASREQSRIDDELGAGHISNISKIQAPSPPFRDRSKQQKMQAMVLLGSIGAALALAFLIELYFDRSLKRPVEIETRLSLPLFISIPRLALNGNGKPKRLKLGRAVPLLVEKNGPRSNGPLNHGTVNTEHATRISNRESQISEHGKQATEHETQIKDQGTQNTQLAPAPRPSPLDSLRPFCETLRDRLISFFELKNLTHKPKLVAVTSCGEGAGVTTTAAGLAASLSETGDGNVLLVDMNLQQGAAHHFHKGSLACGLDDALEIGKRDSALVQDNLYVVSEATNGDQLPRVLPKRFKHLVPRMKASDYDYIIFDMPPVSQISATPRLAGFMDMVFMVVESEKTDRDVVKRAAALLAESRCNLGVILNKARSYVPKQLQQEL